MAALTLANQFANEPIAPKKKVCILERGQWWISHELTYTKPAERRNLPANMREFLRDKGYPHNFWPHPDNVKGLIDFASKTKEINDAGLYDYTALSDRIHVITASGVGGGSLVYSNVTLEPPSSVYKDWPTETNGTSLSEYFEPARIFIGVNRITTVAGLGKPNTKLEKSKVFQDAADKIRSSGGPITNPSPPNDPDFGFALDLSITNIPENTVTNFNLNNGVLQPNPPLGISLEEFVKQQNQQNVCERQGRCNLGCLPGARHTLNKKLITTLGDAKTQGVLEVRALSEADYLEFKEPDRYVIHYHPTIRDGGSEGESADRELVTSKLVVAAGTLGTSKLLWASYNRGLRLSKLLGKGFSTDGDLIGFMQLRNRIDITRGPINTCHAFFTSDGKKFAYSIEDTTIPKMVAPLIATIFDLAATKRHPANLWIRLKNSFTLTRRYGIFGLGVIIFGLDLPKMQKVLTGFFNNKTINKMLKSLAQPQVDGEPDPWGYVLQNGPFRLAQKLIEIFTRDHDNPNASPEERLSKYFIFSCMGLDNAGGELRLDAADNLRVTRWSFEENSAIFEEIIKGMKLLAEAIEPGSRVIAPTWMPDPTQRSLVVLHPLGGCRIAEDADHGVVNSYGQVFRDDPTNRKRTYDNFYIMDGSIVPSALGVNSSLTITALAFRCSEHMAGNRDFWPSSNLIKTMTALEKMSGT